MGETAMRPAASSRTRSIAFVGLTIAVMAVSAWVTIPIGRCRSRFRCSPWRSPSWS